MSFARTQLIDSLKEQIARLDNADPARMKRADMSTGVPDLDKMLPGGGLRGGTLLEWLSANEANGALSVAMVLAGIVQRQGGAIVVVDRQGDFYPPAASASGIVLSRTIVVQPTKAADALWAWEQSLRSVAVGVSLGWMDAINDRTFRRLQLAAEAGGTLGFLLRPLSARGEPSWAAARLLVEALPTGNGLSAAGRRLRVEVLHCRGGAIGRATELELSHEANVVRLVPALAHPAPARGAAGA